MIINILNYKATGLVNVFEYKYRKAFKYTGKIYVWFGRRFLIGVHTH